MLASKITLICNSLSQSVTHSVKMSKCAYTGCLKRSEGVPILKNGNCGYIWIIICTNVSSIQHNDQCTMCVHCLYSIIMV